MLYGVEMTIPLGIVIGEVGRQKPKVHCPNEYVEWLCASIRDVHAVARAYLKKSAKRQKRGYDEASRTVKFQCGDWVWLIYPSISSGKLCNRNKDPGLVFAKTGPVTQRFAGAEPELVYVDKLLPFQADIGEELGFRVRNKVATG